MSPSLPPSLIAKLSPTCRWRGCSDTKADGADWCPKHHEKQKGYQRKSQARINAARDQARECRACGGKLPSRWNSTRCKQCQREQAETAKSARLKDAARRLKNAAPAARGHFKTEVYGDGAARTRFVGQSHRGGPTRQEQDAGLVKLALDAQRLLAGFLAVFPEERPQIDALPRIQRAEAWALVTSSGTRAARLILGVMADLGDPVASEVLRLLDAASEG